MRKHARSKDGLFHLLFVFRIEANFKIDLPQVQSNLDWDPELPVWRLRRPENRAPISTNYDDVTSKCLEGLGYDRMSPLLSADHIGLRLHHFRSEAPVRR